MNLILDNLIFSEDNISDNQIISRAHEYEFLQVFHVTTIMSL
jgi:hypothetical protein